MKTLEKRNPVLFEEIVRLSSYLPEDTNLSVRLVFLDEGHLELPSCKKCGVRHHNRTHDRLKVNPYCSKACMFSDREFMKERASKIDQKKRMDTFVKNNLAKYGYAYPSQRPDLKHFWTKTKLKSEESHAKLLSYDWLVPRYESGLSLTEIADELGVFYGTVSDYLRDHGVEIRTRIKVSREERKIERLLEEHGISYDSNTNSVLGNRELDFYIPDRKVAIEINGLYWHTERCGRGPTYHLQKTMDCLDRGIKLIHFLDRDVNEKFEIVKAMVLNSVGVNEKTLRASKCDIREIPTHIARDFIDQNHLQGYASSDMKIGLFHGDDLVSVMTVGKTRFSKIADYEIIRFCSKNGVKVHGAASKLFGYVRQIIPEKDIMSYADRMTGEGGVYQKLGFELVRSTSPGYFWTDGKEVLSRYVTMRSKLSDKFPDYAGETEVEFMESKGFSRYFTCGNNVYLHRSHGT